MARETLDRYKLPASRQFRLKTGSEVALREGLYVKDKNKAEPSLQSKAGQEYKNTLGAAGRVLRCCAGLLYAAPQLLSCKA